MKAAVSSKSMAVAALLVGLFLGVALTLSSGFATKSIPLTTTTTSVVTTTLTSTRQGTITTTSAYTVTATVTTIVAHTTSATAFATDVSFSHSGTNGSLRLSNTGSSNQQVRLVGLNYSGQVCTWSYTTGPIISVGSSIVLIVTYFASGQPCGGYQANQASAFSGFVDLINGDTVSFSGTFG